MRSDPGLAIWTPNLLPNQRTFEVYCCYGYLRIENKFFAWRDSSFLSPAILFRIAMVTRAWQMSVVWLALSSSHGRLVKSNLYLHFQNLAHASIQLGLHSRVMGLALGLVKGPRVATCETFVISRTVAEPLKPSLSILWDGTFCKGEVQPSSF